MNRDTDNLLNSENNPVDLITPKRKWRNMIEPAILLLFLGWSLPSIIFQNELMISSCISVFDFNKTDCLELQNQNKSAEVQIIDDVVQPYVAKLLMCKMLIDAIIPAIFSLFVGPWSDKFGRKPILNLTFSGLFVSSVIIFGFSYMSEYTDINPWYYILASLPYALSGGTCCMLIGLLCYTTDISNDSNRGMKMGLLEGNIFLGALLGTLASSYLLNYTNSTIVFGISAAIIFLSSSYVILVLNESVKITEETSKTSKLREFMSLTMMRKMLSTLIKKRQNNERRILWLAISVTVMAVFTMQGSSNVSYLFVRDKFGWTVRENSFYASTSMLVLVVGTILCIYLFKTVFKLSDIMAAIIGLISSVFSTLVRAFASEPWHLYLSICVGFIAGIFSPMMRSVITKTVPSSEIGKVFSITSSFETISVLGAAPLYTYIYTSTYKEFPGAFNLITAIIYGLALLIGFYIYYLIKTKPESEPETAVIINEETDSDYSYLHEDAILSYT